MIGFRIPKFAELWDSKTKSANKRRRDSKYDCIILKVSIGRHGEVRYCGCSNKAPPATTSMQFLIYCSNYMEANNIMKF